MMMAADKAQGPAAPVVDVSASAVITREAQKPPSLIRARRRRSRLPRRSIRLLPRSPEGKFKLRNPALWQGAQRSL